MARRKQLTKTYTWWYHINKGYVRASKTLVKNMVYKYTSKEVKP